MREADTALAVHVFDPVILDLGLPTLSGEEILRRLRGRDSRIPVLILTASDSVEQRVRGLDLGADDYMAKPFARSELEARVRALNAGVTAGAPASCAMAPYLLTRSDEPLFVRERRNLDLNTIE